MPHYTVLLILFLLWLFGKILKQIRSETIISKKLDILINDNETVISIGKINARIREEMKK